MRGHTVCAWAYRKEGKYDEAISDYTKALEINPHDLESRYFRGMTYGQSGQHDHALADFTAILDKQPRDARAYYGRGAVRLEKDEFEDAIHDFTTAIEIDSRYVDAYLGRGFAFLRHEEYDRAISDFSTAIELNPQSANAYHGRGGRCTNRRTTKPPWSTSTRLHLSIRKIPLSTTIAPTHTARWDSMRRLGPMCHAKPRAWD